MNDDLAAICDRERLGPFLLMYFSRVTAHVFGKERCENLGSLINPRRDATDFVHRDLHRDPPEFREWVIGEYLDWLRIRVECEREIGLAGAMLRYLESPR